MTGAVRLSDYAGAAWLAARREASSTYNASGLTRVFSGAPAAPKSLLAAAPDLRRGDIETGKDLVEGRFLLAGESLAADDPASVWTSPAPSRSFARLLHGFGWLRDLRAAMKMQGEAGEAARDAALALVDGWIAEFGGWNSFAWRADILADRLIAWLQAGDTLFAEAETDKPARHRLRIAARQARRLESLLPMSDEGAPRVRAAIALSLAGLCLSDQERFRTSGLALLSKELDRQILPDGGHISRSPSAGADILIDLAMLREAAGAAGVETPDSVLKAMERLAPTIRFFQMSDQGLACFHAGGESDRKALERALKAAAVEARPFGFAPHSGYHRAHAGGATVLFDVGEAPRGALSADAHASALAFEMDTAGGRLVVNCGWSEDQPSHWREAVRASAAHSTLTLEETSSARLLPSGWRRSLLGPRMATAPGPVTARRNEEDMGVWLEGVHEGYRDLYGLNHRRRIFLAADGGDLRGEDALFRPVDDGAPEDVDIRHRFAIRFHLHPSVRASLSRDQMSALLVQANGDGWRFRTDGGPVRLERSVYLGAGAPPQRATQIVVQGEAEPFGAGDRPPNRVRWAFQRLGRIGGAEGEAGETPEGAMPAAPDMMSERKPENGS